jgi:acetylornithine deacetylase/succinyl-diaminopimelate desuccinylase-like protein
MLALLTTAMAGAPDWAALGQETAELLSLYIQAGGKNPPGGETAAAAPLMAKLDAEGIPYELWEPVPGRGNLIARLEGGDQPPLCLLSHLDVVPAEADRWSVDPFGGAIQDGYVWGRGALDMKGMGAMELMAMVQLKRSGVRLDRDVILVAVADEEVDNAGVQQVMARWDELGCSHVLNEGGLGLRDLLFEGANLYAISVGEKGVLWLRMTAEGQPGHGSTPRPDEAPERLLRALDALRERETELSWHPAMLELFDAVGQRRSGMERFVLTHPWWTRRLLEGTLTDNPLTHAVLVDTVHLTGLEGANEPNVVPSKASALLDCRLLPGTDPQDLLDELIARVDDPQVSFEVLQSVPAQVSAWRDDPLYAALVNNLELADPTAAVGPAISPGFTDSIYLRSLGVTAYGMVPILITAEDAATMHGDDERVAVAELGRGVRVLVGTIEDFAGATPAGETP